MPPSIDLGPWERVLSCLHADVRADLQTLPTPSLRLALNKFQEAAIWTRVDPRNIVSL
jgi:hypothetical protein